MSRAGGIILAAGASSRLGRPKQLLPLGEQPVIAHTVAAARQSTLDAIVLVVGAHAAEVLSAIDTTALIVVHNPDYAEGQSTSVRAGIQALPNDVDAALFLLGDQPLVCTSVIDALVRARQTNGAPLVQPLYRDGPGNPVLVGRELFAELQQVTGDIGARPLLQRHRESIAWVPVECKRPLDIDTSEDYERIQRAFEESR